MSALEEVVAQLLLRQPAPLLRPLHIQVGALPQIWPQPIQVNASPHARRQLARRWLVHGRLPHWCIARRVKVGQGMW